MWVFLPTHSAAAASAPVAAATHASAPAPAPGGTIFSPQLRVEIIHISTCPVSHHDENTFSLVGHAYQHTREIKQLK